jgi:hypothetical protein
MESANANNLDRNSGERSGGTAFAQTKAQRVSSQILPAPFGSFRLADLPGGKSRTE